MLTLPVLLAAVVTASIAGHEPTDHAETRIGDDAHHGGGHGATAAQWALGHVGKPYVWGGTGPHGFDCSGLVMRAWQHAGTDIPRVTTDQYRIGTPVPLDRLRPGDLLFYDTGGPGGAPAHVTMYVGDGQMVNAPSSGKTIRVEPVESAYYGPLFMGARRP
ncbi:C40 family peptidase [Streptomonospora nanhaiensis]|uniref:C40 family peptidase n=1 Tax=Streptomonospora nanhaiensis TaxID=1323731 RepID=UPI0027E151A0|nr:NlpC/P60 family protein [Streptomonospora nanhaiensis]